MNKTIITTFWLSVGLISLLPAQNFTLNPYSRYAIGDIFQTTTTRNAAMGGIGMATDNYFSINRSNPASYADLLYTTMDVSAFGQFNRMESKSAVISPFNAGFHDAAFAFPSNKGPAFTFGFAPYSAVGYEVSTQKEIQLDTTYIERNRYNGGGGLNQAFLGVAFRMLKRRLRLGVNMQYVWGNTEYNWSSELFQSDSVASTLHNPIRVQEVVFVNGVIGTAGVMYVDTLNSEKRTLIRLGGTVESTVGMKGDRATFFDNGTIADSLSTLERSSITLPLKVGAGVMIHRLGKWSAGADFTFQDWGTFSYFSDNPELGPEVRFGIGAEITPDFESQNYLKRISYRFGGYWKQTYIQFGGTPVKDFGVSLGFGVPAGAKGNSRFNPGRASSKISVSAELGRRGAFNEGLPLEQYYARLRLGIAINDRWFIRRVVD
ncbi:MAG: hypothetical protein AAF587_01855 [Bacteroidota bacterium]